MKTLYLCALLTLMAATAYATGVSSPYAAFIDREIKSLSEKDIQGYKDGKGMGLSFAAELNNYPGPKHALEIKGELSLTEDQLVDLQESKASMSKTAKEIGAKILTKERELDRLFSGGSASEETVSLLVTEIAELKGRLRNVHLKAHMETRDILTEQQVNTYNMLRGYTKSHQ